MYYRVCILDRDGHIRRTVEFDCADDDAAKQAAIRMLDSHDIEVWQHDRRVAVLNAHASDYRLYFYDKDGLLTRPAMIINADTDDTAIAEADKRVGDLGAELWDRHHILKEFAPKARRSVQGSSSDEVTCQSEYGDEMNLVAEYLERAAFFERFAATESNSELKEQLQDQAKAYRELAVKRSDQLSRPMPASPADL